jgi:hypothetical protein
MSGGGAKAIPISRVGGRHHLVILGIGHVSRPFIVEGSRMAWVPGGIEEG